MIYYNNMSFDEFLHINETEIDEEPFDYLVLFRDKLEKQKEKDVEAALFEYGVQNDSE